MRNSTSYTYLNQKFLHLMNEFSTGVLELYPMTYFIFLMGGGRRGLVVIIQIKTRNLWFRY